VSNKLKYVGKWLLGIVGFLAFLAIPAVFLVGAELLSESLSSWFNLASILALAFALFVVLPLSVFRRCRGFAAIASLVASHVFGATLWMEALLLTLALWGGWAVVIGLFMMGVGVVPIAILATLHSGMWSILVFYAFWIGDRTDMPDEI
jgi:hypothetical protein